MKHLKKRRSLFSFFYPGMKPLTVVPAFSPPQAPSFCSQDSEKRLGFFFLFCTVFLAGPVRAGQGSLLCSFGAPLRAAARRWHGSPGKRLDNEEPGAWLAPWVLYSTKPRFPREACSEEEREPLRERWPALPSEPSPQWEAWS